MSIPEEKINQMLYFKDVKGKPLMHKGHYIDENCSMIILMMGPRRCGKTSILTSISQCLKKVCAETNLCIEPRSSEGGISIFRKNKTEPERLSSTTKFFNEKREDLIKFTNNPSNIFNNFKGNSGIAGSSDIVNYDFVISCNNNPASMLLLRFIDLPGEYYTDDDDIAEKLITRSDCIIIAVDTPALMSGNQVIQNKVNQSDRINECFLSNLKIDKNDKKSRLVLFAPLKSEKWFRIDEQNDNNTQMDKIVDCIKKYYEDTIRRLSNDSLKNMFSLAVTPVMTVGGVVFSCYNLNKDETDFEFNDNGEPIPNYIKDIKNEGYYPKYCEQPLLYFFSFLNNLLKAKQLKPGLFNLLCRFEWYVALQQIFTNTAKPVYDELDKVLKQRIKVEKGFAVISDESKLLE